MRKSLFLPACLIARLAEDAVMAKVRRLQGGVATPWDARALLHLHRSMLRRIERLPLPEAAAPGGSRGPLGLSDQRVAVVPYDPRWPALFEAEAGRVRGTFTELLEIHHIGSTAVVGLAAKPIVDFTAVLPAEFLRQQPDALRPRMEALGYRYLGNWGRRGGRVFIKANAAGDAREFLCQVHEPGAPTLAGLLRCRDRLRESTAARADYAAVKAKLAAVLARYRITYVWAKGHYLSEIELGHPGPAAWADYLIAAQAPSLLQLVRKAGWRAISRRFGRGRTIYTMEAARPAK